MRTVFKYKHLILSVILAIWAVAFAAAQEHFVFTVGETRSCFVEEHEGSTFDWTVFNEPTFTVSAAANEVNFLNGNTGYDIDIQWEKPGLYYITVIETDMYGCTNTKAMAVTVLPNERSAGFEVVASHSCFNRSGNSFNLDLFIKDNDGLPLDARFFPLKTAFTVNGVPYSALLEYNNPAIQISDQWFSTGPGINTEVAVEMTDITDNNDVSLQIVNAIHTRTIYALPEIEFESMMADTIALHSYYSFSVISGSDYQYEWWFTDSSNIRSDFSSDKPSTEELLWDTEGRFELFVQATDQNGCLSEIVSKPFVVTPDYQWVNLAGRDTVIGSCEPYTLSALDMGEGFSYSWQPAALLDNPDSRTPLFMPGETTTFILTVSNDHGFSAKDSVEITVSEIVADAGEDLWMYAGETALLEGSNSSGQELHYLWTTENGIIESGETTASPVVKGIGAYVLEVTDRFGCTATDTVHVGLLTYAPVAMDDYDTTEYRTPVKIYVLDNDNDPDNDLDSMSLRLTVQPMHGSAVVDYSDFSVEYTPGRDYHGSDRFEYRICDLTSNCSEASVFVLVNDFRFIIPNAFSPNNDGVNDYFEIPGIEFYEGNTIEIFNRWGNRVYRASNYGIDTSPTYWDGKSNTGVRLGNEELPSGTYFYVLNLGNGEKSIVGSVYLDR